ncbi:hypothetical protein GCM10009864_64480 [Streptomyces lunalinharesii]|uniref:Methyltransferase n=1 Tax=Streptomyces lunalinharesii TaxID=333384 RepID=A0ABN3SRU7_9ACTN
MPELTRLHAGRSPAVLAFEWADRAYFAASRRVLVTAGFVPVGPAEPADLGGEPGTRYRRDPVLPRGTRWWYGRGTWAFPA